MPSLPGSGAVRPLAQVVLDSNVWIDILVFDDDATRPIHAALSAGLLRAVIDARCLAELSCVLDYPQFTRRAVDKPAALARVAQLSVMAAPAAGAPGGTPALPKCKDRDDQKFLELAHAAGVDWLVSKDRALLKLAKRTAREFGFRIAQPGPFVAACLPPPAVPEANAPAPHPLVSTTSPIAP
ncbi:putative toxin-antitoxin system toxin component, PIN family [Trinickia caryophylli]|uniref:Putative toxin-antitoxin system toxin component, PIN family n=1 Tax=Trinickia caryophylli TaxID=28094 RepID=A0A1X7GW16_TRICW|nr:putative toxin-antitoxin system toxin component, PIN family [Trinickia caryophylli]PMS08678.1 putative toxin-antitoxin system toxin component, PIN family [Trinickia caryophylli]TRX18050.1 putative toxin-antitoxin system toxin component, PIN family [Trinickia caryophylli]WQE11167.1 putative toxin-antitoxin system toxin component, PIN family [Trinickia caryophylli]SMF75405.1 putative toxin-antitoxin system toxin component, PIN family [Trinickia caryophylli]GLU35328.1 PIN domain-containing pro